MAEQGREIQKLRRANEGLNELKEGMKECTLLLQGFRQQTTGVVAKQQQSTTSCPMCTEEILPPMRLRQCWEGHIICDSCFARDEEVPEREGRERGQCGVCRGAITGRLARTYLIQIKVV